MNQITIVGMIYKSCSYLDFMMKGIKTYCLQSPGLSVDYVIVANDASTKVKEKLESGSIKHLLYNDPKPDDYYLNRVYRAWNFGGFNAKGDVLVFINSDMAFTPHWLNRLISKLTPDTIPCSRLVESGKLLSGQHAISKDFGRTSAKFRENLFLDYAHKAAKSETHSGGLFMPCAFYKKDFEASGGYPEGNIYQGGPGVVSTKFLQSGDDYFFYKNQVMSSKRHITVFDSIVYHVQEGEKDE